MLLGACTFLVVVTCAADPGNEHYDPLEGIDPTGRIPRPELPADLPNPERWRYIPEGRIKPGNVFQRLLVSSFIFPIVFIESDVGFGGGVGVTDIDFRNQRRREFAGIFLTATTEGQQSYRMAWRRWLHQRELPKGGVLQEERSFLRAKGGYSKTLTRRFFGLGPDTQEKDETSYTDEATVFSFGLDRAFPRPGDDLVATAGVRAEFHNLSDGEVSDVPSTSKEFPVIFAFSEDTNIGWLEAGLRYDTRDSQRNPYKGWEVSALAEGALLQSHGNVGGRFTLNGSKTLVVPGLFHEGGDPDEQNPPTDTLALGLWTQTSTGDLPFYDLPTLGGADRLRGYIAGRWRDRAGWFAGAEYRFWVLARGFNVTRTIRIERVGGALFYGAGAVADSWGGLFDSRLRSSYGVSLRFSLERAAPFRLDFGASDEGVFVNGGFGLPF